MNKADPTISFDQKTTRSISSSLESATTNNINETSSNTFFSKTSSSVLSQEINHFLNMLSKPSQIVKNEKNVKHNEIFQVQSNVALSHLVAQALGCKSYQISRSQLFETAILKYALLLNNKINKNVNLCPSINDQINIDDKASYTIKNDEIVITYNNLTEVQLQEIVNIYNQILGDKKVKLTKHEIENNISYDLCFDAKEFAKVIIPGMYDVKAQLITQNNSSMNIKI